MGRLDGKVAFITGAARGQGRAHAVTMAAEGADIIAVDICADIDGVKYPLATAEDLVDTVRIVEQHDRRCIGITADARSTVEIRAAADRDASELGGIDIAVVNHGIMMVHGWDEITDEEWDETISTNLTAAWKSSRAVIPHMIARGGGALTIPLPPQASPPATTSRPTALRRPG